MKLVLIIAFFSLVLARKIHESTIKQWERIISPFHHSCAQESKVDPIIMEEMLNTLEFPEDKNVYNYYKCIETHLGLFYPNGKLNPEEVVKKLPFVSISTAQACVSKFQHITDQAEYAYKAATCGWQDIAA